MNVPPGNDASHWSRESLRYDVLHERAAIVARIVVAGSHATVLELGASTGQLLNEVIRQSQCTSYFATDISAEALRSISGASVAQVDLNHERIPFDSINFDCIVGSGILEYIDDVPALLEQCRSRLRPGGRVVVSYVNSKSLRRRLLSFLRRSQGDPTWRRLVAPEQLVSAATNTGFKLRTVRGLRGRIRQIEGEVHMPRLHDAVSRGLRWQAWQLIYEFSLPDPIVQEPNSSC